MIKKIFRFGTAAVLAACIGLSSAACHAKTNIMELNQLLTKLDSRSSTFLLNLMLQKEQMIENDKYFNQAKALLPVTYENYQLKDMNKNDHELFLTFNSTDPKVLNLWEKNHDRFKLKFYKGVCSAFKKYNFRKIDEVTVSIEYNSKLMTTLNQKKNSCIQTSSGTGK